MDPGAVARIDQVEFADVIVLDKLDLATEREAGEVEAISKALDPGVRILPATRGQVPLESVPETSGKPEAVHADHWGIE